MPTYSAIALDRFIEPGPAKSMVDVKNAADPKLQRRSSAPNSRPERRNGASATTLIDKKQHWSPALYATPKSTPLPDSPSSYPPSPYIINHKRRGPRLLKSSSEDDVVTHNQALHMENGAANTEVAETKVADSVVDVTFKVAPSPVEGVQVNGNYVCELGSNELADSPALALEREDDAVEDFLDPRDSMSVKSNIEVESNSGVERPYNLNTPVAEFFDAWEELSSENGPNGPLPSPHDLEAELRDMRLSLLMEIEKRKQAEEALSNMQSHWMRIRQQLSLVGLTLPANPHADAEDDQLEFDPAEELCQQVYLARFVSNSIGRGTARAEVEMEMEAQIESKNFEIARLWDRLHYYEAVNREMSQRNQEAVEMARRLRQRRRRRQRWVWGSITAAVVLGTAGLAWAYLPSGKGSASTSQFVAPERNDAAK